MADDIDVIYYVDDDIVVLDTPSGSYSYSVEELDNNLLDRLIGGGAEYTVYSQGEERDVGTLTPKEVLEVLEDEWTTI